MNSAGDLVAGLGQLLDDEGIGVWSPGEPPAAGVGTAAGLPLITSVRLPSQPERVICLTDYYASRNGALSDAEVSVQCRIRGDQDPATARTIADQIQSALHGRTHFDVHNGDNSVHIVQCRFLSEAPLGPDGNGRHERAINLSFNVNRAGAYVETGS